MDIFDLLMASGWYPGRCVDTSTAESVLVQKGYRLHNAAIAVLAEFSGLTIHGPSDPVKSHARQMCLRIDADQPMEDPRSCRDYSDAVGDILVPVGTELCLTVLVGERGAVWGSYGSEYGFIADSFVEAVGRIFLSPPSEWSLDRTLPPGPDAEERIRRRQLEDERHQAGGWRRFWARRM